MPTPMPSSRHVASAGCLWPAGSRIATTLALAGAALVLAGASGAAAHPRHHRHGVVIVRHVVRHVPPRAIFPDRDAAAATRAAGFVTGYVDAGILGATTADPYEHPAYGYDVRGRRGPGYDYYGD